MVNLRRTAPLLPLLLAACGPDVPTRCTIETSEQLLSIVSFSNDKVDDNPLRYCVGVNVASRRDASASSPGRDESFATSRSGAIPWTNVTYADAAAACGRAGQFLCERRVLGPIRAVEVTGTGPQFDKTWVEALSPTQVGHPADALEPIALSTDHVPVAFPDTAGSIAVWTAEGYVAGRIVGGLVQSGDPTAYAEIDAPGFKHPLVGFRCCVDARLQGVLEPFAPDPMLIRAEVDDVPIR